MKLKLSIVMVGWYFKNTNLYKNIIKEANFSNNLKLKYYIASHKNPEEINKELKDELIQLGWKILYFKNEGWDWGAYQQFLIWQKKNELLSDYYLFLHDDIKIEKNGFIEAFLRKIQNGAKVIGNGLPYLPPLEKKWSLISPEIVYWSKINKFPIKAKVWRCVRGSCFFTTKGVVENIFINMPIKKGYHKGFGNWSVKIFGGLITSMYGKNSIEYIGDKKLESFYIKEEYRGGIKTIFLKYILNKVKSLIPSSVRGYIRGYRKGQKVPPSPEGLKLNLGCGRQYCEGYLNIDINSRYADLKADILSLEFEKESISEVLMVHVIEHIDYFKLTPFLRKIYRWLKANGQLIVEFPDIVKVARCILKTRNDVKKLQNSLSGIRGIYGESMKNMTIYDYHKWGWSEKTIKSLLRETGFKKIYIEKPQYHGCHSYKDTRIVAIK